MKALTLVLLLALPAYAQPSDCELRVEEMQRSINLKDATLQAAGRALVGKDAEIASLQASLKEGVPLKPLIIVGVVGLVVGAVVAGVVVATVKK